MNWIRAEFSSEDPSTWIITGPVRPLQPGAVDCPSVSGKPKLTHRHLSSTQAAGEHASPGFRSSAGTDIVVPARVKLSVICASASGNAGFVFHTVTTWPGCANGDDTEPLFDWNVVGADGITLQGALANVAEAITDTTAPRM